MEPAHGRGHPGGPSHPSLPHLPGKVLFAGASGQLREGVGWPHARLGAGGAWGAYGPEGGPGAGAGPGGGPFGGGGGGTQLRRPPHAARGVPDPGPPPLHPGDGGRGEGGGKAVRHPDALWGAGGAGGRAGGGPSSPSRSPLLGGGRRPVSFLTAYLALVRAQARPGEWVLVQAAAGALGTAAVQVAKALGLRVLGAASRPEKLPWSRPWGQTPSPPTRPFRRGCGNWGAWTSS